MLARAALTAVLTGGRPAAGPRLLVVVATDAGRLLADLGDDVHDARRLARRLAVAEARGTRERLLAELLATGWLVITAVDRIGRPAGQRVIASLLDAVIDRGGEACVGISVPPVAAALDPVLESRLSAGLVVTVPGGRRRVPAPAARASVREVIRTTARLQGVSVVQLVGQCRQRSIVRSRCIAIYVARICTGSSLDAIGEAFGGRDHTTAMRSVRAVESRLPVDMALADDVRDVVSALDGRAGKSRPA